MGSKALEAVVANIIWCWMRPPSALLTSAQRAENPRAAINAWVGVATGHLHYRHVPAALAGLGGFVSHSSEHHDLSRFAGRIVTVIGCGQS